MFGFKSILLYSYFNSRQIKKWRLLIFALAITLFQFVPISLKAHPSPNSLIFLDINPDIVQMEVLLPVPELELSFKKELLSHPEDILNRWGSEIQKYLLHHISAYTEKGKPWHVEVIDLKMEKNFYADNVTPYWEIAATVRLTPVAGGNTRNFFLDYDVILHEVINHITLLSIRSDWESGNLGDDHTISKATGEDALVIARDLNTNKIHPLHINLQNGNRWSGFRAMVVLGMRHISEGTDHLMFLLMLLLPAPLLINKGSWAGFKGLRSSIFTLLKIITAFTAGHSVTLLAGTLGWFHFPSRPIEILIAFSVFISALNAFRPVFHGKEAAIAAGFGLIHGMAFASTLSELHLNSDTLLISLLGFNAGIELMQILIVIIIIPWLIIMSKTPYYKWFRYTMALITSLAAVGWMLERGTSKKNLLTKYLEEIPDNGHWFLLILTLTTIVMYAMNRWQLQRNNI